jgi:hypothetical protein
MQSKNIKAERFYTTKDGETVRVTAVGVKEFHVYNEAGQDYYLKARDFVKEVPDPTLPVLRFKDQAALDKAAFAGVRARYITNGSKQS